MEATEEERIALLSLALTAGCTPLQARTLLDLLDGKTVEEIAEERGVLVRGVYQTRRSAHRRIQQHLGAPAPKMATSRQLEAISLYMQGHNFTEIAHTLNISRDNARRLVRRGLDRDRRFVGYKGATHSSGTTTLGKAGTKQSAARMERAD